MPPYEPPSTTTFWVCDSEAWLDGPEMEALLEDAAELRGASTAAAGFLRRIGCAMVRVASSERGARVVKSQSADTVGRCVAITRDGESRDVHLMAVVVLVKSGKRSARRG